MADTVASIDQSVVIDLDALSKTRQTKFLTAFLDRLYDVNRKPILLICDEADRYAPQKPMSQAMVLSLSASEDICRRGRKRGIGNAWLTQRTAVLNKNVSDICDLTVVFRTPGSRDLKELEERVGRIASKQQVGEVMRHAPALEDGQAFFLSSHPKLRKFMPDPIRPIQLPMPWTFDSSASPGVGQRWREPKVLAKSDLAAIEQKMSTRVEKAKAEDPKELQKKVADLQRQLAVMPAAAPPAKERRVEIKAIPDAQIKRLESFQKTAGQRITMVSDRMATLVNPLIELLYKEQAEIGQILVAARAVSPVPSPPSQSPAPSAASATQHKSVREIKDVVGRDSLD